MTAPLHDDVALVDLAEKRPTWEPDPATEGNPSAPVGPFLPRVLCARDFINAKRPRLQYHIEGLLPRRGKLGLSAPAKWSKSFFAIQAGYAMAAGDCEWLGLKFGPPARVLYFQAELSDELIEDRLAALLDTMPPEIDREKAGENFLIQEIVGGPPDFAAKQMVIEALISADKPDVVIVDPLCFCFPGLEENEASAMSKVLSYLSGLTQRFNCAVIVLHHCGKSGVSRGSSVWEGWPDTELTGSFVDPELKDVGKIVGRFRCCYRRGPWYWRLPTPDNLWIESMPEEYVPDAPKGKKGRRSIVTGEMVVLILRDAKRPMIWTELKDRIQTTTNCARTAANDAIQEAVASGKIFHDGKHYAALDGENSI